MSIGSRITLAVVALVLVTGAAPDQKITFLPPYTPAYEPQSVDERGMWMVADEQEMLMRGSALRVKDEKVINYVRRVFCETVGDARCQSVRIYVLEVPLFNASMAPNGAMVVWTGLLLRVRSEAELASVLAHEFAHFELRHGLQGFKQQRGATDAMAWLQVLGAMSNTNMVDTSQSLLGSIYRFNRLQEQQADMLGLTYLRQSRYPASSAATVWRHIMAEEDATAAGRGYKNKKSYSSGFFDTHPTSMARAEYLDKAAAEAPDPGDDDIAGHQLALGAIRSRLLAAQIKMNDFGGTGYLLTELARVNGWTGELLFARAELHRERGNPRDLVTAADLYDQGIKAGYQTPEAYRGLGLARLKTGAVSGGREALVQYLKLKPDAGDAAVIQTLLK